MSALFNDTYFLILSNIGFVLLVLMYIVVFPINKEE